MQSTEPITSPLTALITARRNHRHCCCFGQEKKPNGRLLHGPSKSHRLGTPTFADRTAVGLAAEEGTVSANPATIGPVDKLVITAQCHCACPEAVAYAETSFFISSGRGRVNFFHTFRHGRLVQLTLINGRMHF